MKGSSFNRASRPIRQILFFSTALAYGVGLWHLLLHHPKGGHEHHEAALATGGVTESNLPQPAIALAAAVLIVAAVALVVRRAPRARLTAIGAILAAAFLLPGSVVAGASEAESCLSGGAPANEAFDVRAIDVDIPLNRFGDHDPKGKMYVFAGRVDDVRDQERTRHVTLGLRNDPIQPLVIRANLGQCVELGYRDEASGGDYGIQIDGVASKKLAADRYRFWIPVDSVHEGTHYLHPGAGFREAVSHGLYGALIAEPQGAVYRNPRTFAELKSGWEAIIDLPAAGMDFREAAQVWGEVGNEKYQPLEKNGGEVPLVDGVTEAYRPATRVINYRTEPFRNRLLPREHNHMKSLAYSSYAFGDPATPVMRGYLGDPTKIRLIHAGSEVSHVFHLHGGSVRWRMNRADPTMHYEDTGLDKHPEHVHSPSARLDSQTMGPSESFNLENEGGAGGNQQSAGDFTYHCHIAEHYISGMWGFWRVYNTRQDDLKQLADRAAPADAVDSIGLLNKPLADGTVLDTVEQLNTWIKSVLPPRGTPNSKEDASVWNWRIAGTQDKPLYLGEPEDTSDWPNLPQAGDVGFIPKAELVDGRPRILFNEENGRPAYPLLRPHVGTRPPFAANGHSGAPYLGEGGKTQPTTGPWSGKDAICPRTRRDGSPTPEDRFQLVSIETPVQVTRAGRMDDHGRVFVLAGDRAGEHPEVTAANAEPLAIRTNIEDCVDVTLVNELPDQHLKSNLHIHHTQFDIQGSDGAVIGFNYETSIYPYRNAETTAQLTADAAGTTLSLTRADKLHLGAWVGVGLGTEKVEVRQIEAIQGNTVTLTDALEDPHASGEYVGVEFAKSRWYPDVALDNIFFHDHVDGIHGWPHGLVGQLVVEPWGAEFRDPKTGEEVKHGTIVDVHVAKSCAAPAGLCELVKGLSPEDLGRSDGSFRELVVWPVDSNESENHTGVDSTFNLRAEPFGDRGGDASRRFSSHAHGDPWTPLPRAYPGDPFVIRTVPISPTIGTVHVDGHRFWWENRYVENGRNEASRISTLHAGVSERFSLLLQGGAGGPRHQPGDYLYWNGIDRRFRDGAWGIIRVLGGLDSSLQRLPGNEQPPPPEDTCNVTAPRRAFEISAVDVPSSGSSGGNVRAAFVPTSDAAAVRAGTKQPEPLALHVTVGECVEVKLTNERSNEHVSFHVDGLLRDVESSGVNVGFNPETQAVAPGGSKTYTFFADSETIGSAPIADFAGDESGKEGLYGAVAVARAGARFTDPKTGATLEPAIGTRVDVHLPDGSAYRDFTLVLSDDDPQIGSDFMPYPIDVSGPALVNYKSAPLGDDPNAVPGRDPQTPALKARRDDELRVHVLVAPGSEQMHVFNLGGLDWPLDPHISDSTRVTSRAVGPWETLDAWVTADRTGETFYGDLRRPFTEAGMWGLLRVYERDAVGCPVQALDAPPCS
jgi:FtsP/CotA-like multicopper oxidase with cupredoxin domain